MTTTMTFSGTTTEPCRFCGARPTRLNMFCTTACRDAHEVREALAKPTCRACDICGRPNPWKKFETCSPECAMSARSSTRPRKEIHD